MDNALKEKLEAANRDDFLSPPIEGTPQDKALWMLHVVKNNVKHVGYLSAKDISEALVTQDISVGHVKISRALARSKDLIDKQKNGKDVSFKLMRKGEQLVLAKHGKDKISVLLVDGKKPWQDRRTISDIFSKHIKGDVQIVDPYFGIATLEILENLGNKRSVQFLTSKVHSDGKFPNEWRNFKRQFPNVEVRVLSGAKELHDRYLLSSNEIYLLGHGLKDVGAKESFFVVLADSVSKEIRVDLKGKFVERWSGATPI